MLFAAGLMMGTMYSCTENETPAVKLDTDALGQYSIAAENPEAITFTVSSENGSWELVSDNDWCTIDPRSGNAGQEYTVTVQYEDNTSEDSRTDRLTLRSGETVGKTISVIQAGLSGQGQTGRLTTDPKTLAFTAAAGTEEVTVTSDVAWTAEVTEGDGWLSLGTTVSGDGNGTVEVSASANTSAERTGTIAFKDGNGSVLATLSATQESGESSGDAIVVDNDLVTIPYDQEELVINVTTPGTWYAMKDEPTDDWFSFDESHKTGNGTLAITFENNTTGAVRYAFLTIYSEDESAEPAYVTVTQEPADFVRYYFKDGYKGAGFNYDGAYEGGVEPTFTEEGMAIIGKSRLTRPNTKPGEYTFRFKLEKETSDCIMTLSFNSPWTEVRFGITDARTAISVVYAPAGLTINNVDVSVGEWHEYSFSITELESGLPKYTVSLDGTEVTSIEITDEFSTTPTFGPAYLYFGGEDVVYDWMQTVLL